VLSLNEVLNGAASLLVIAAYFPYVIAILEGKTRPSKATWIIWTAINVMIAGGMLQSGALNAQIAAVTIGDILIVGLAFRYGTPGWKPVEKICLVLAALGAIAWVVTKDPLMAIVIGLAITVLGSVPTATKVWDDPGSENATAFGLMFLSCVVQTAAIPQWTFANALQPIVFFFTAGTIFGLITLRPRKTAKV